MVIIDHTFGTDIYHNFGTSFDSRFVLFMIYLLFIHYLFVRKRDVNGSIIQRNITMLAHLTEIAKNGIIELTML